MTEVMMQLQMKLRFRQEFENVYYVDPENIKEACKLWDYQDDPQEARKKAEELAAKSHLIWSAVK